MTWLKLSDDYPDGMDLLSDAAFRCHTEALSLVLRREKGPVLPKRFVERHLNSPAMWQAISELIDCGWWRDLGESYQVVWHMEHQPEAEVIAKRRADAAERQRRKRLRAAGLDVTSDSRRDAPGDDPRDSGRAGTGRDGTGLAGTTEGWSRNEVKPEECDECRQLECVCAGYTIPGAIL